MGTGNLSQNGAPATANLTTTVANAKLVVTAWDSNESYTAGDPSHTRGPGWANLTEGETAAAAGTWKATVSSSALPGGRSMIGPSSWWRLRLPLRKR
ncbi:MAG TPA: hypothetical protein VFB14_05225 [Bryobacteraceae bacterium]|nr:hypothetical protein [Bryobacteraceae bacterium]